MKTYEQLKQEWGASTYGREFSFYVYEYLQGYAREVADKAWNAGAARVTFNGYPDYPDAPNKEEFMRQLFPEK